MRKVLLSLLIGTAAGAVDILPMIFQGLDGYSIWSALIHWTVLGFVITHIEFGVKPWLKGLITAVLLAFPIIILVMKNDINSVIPILAMSAILGSIVGFVGDKYAK